MTQIKIIYCKECQFLPYAEELKSKLISSLNNEVKIKLEEGDRGIFDVYVGKKLVFSRFKERRFPEVEEINNFFGRK